MSKHQIPFENLKKGLGTSFAVFYTRNSCA